ncbi:DUF226 domain-containing protein [Borreliella burgdorferi]|uniref:Uncharacterized protein n=1 Tax=Borreliella burgdorferi 118a TaxID=476210 RepID=A0A7U3YBD0_BORBG|nr:DUF226 domain-containing protein [Borreliella burgdorferi]ACM10255.1 conserved hypothetical protein [Borreliella burgdorferi 72a]ACN92222.1 conserved hypothetical protein [Borreliella burgdorferi 94a]ACN92960.1 conserved hypothetical protein [Borreliella burgdorferi 118a]AXK69751.1 hypothetical protein BbuMM1_K190 [Borreliella burgdorferi]MCD2383689.1 DUF226 domain-containing protein [Borreliella burgdorferi]
MSNLLEKLRNKKSDIEKRIIFNRIEEIDSRKIYCTKIFKHLISFKITNKGKRLRLTFQEFNNNEDFLFFNLFPLRENDKFLEIKYKHDKLDRPFFLKKENNKTYAIKKLYYIEFVFKNGSIKAYVQSLRTLLRKNKETTEYYQFNLSHLKKMEKKVYEFYNKKLKDGGVINKWIKKNQL